MVIPRNPYKSYDQPCPYGIKSGIKMAALGVRKSIIALTKGTLSKLAIGASAVMLILKAAVVKASTAKFDANSFVSIGSPFKLPTFWVKFAEIYIRGDSREV